MGVAHRVLVRPVFAVEELVRLEELLDRLHEGFSVICGQYWERASAISGAGFHVLLKVLLDVLVVDVELIFERIQLRLVEDLPPVAAQHGILRTGDLPAVLILEVDRGFLVIGGGHLGWRGSDGISVPHYSRRCAASSKVIAGAAERHARFAFAIMILLVSALMRSLLRSPGGTCRAFCP